LVDNCLKLVVVGTVGCLFSNTVNLVKFVDAAEFQVPERERVCADYLFPKDRVQWERERLTCPNGVSQPAAHLEKEFQFLGRDRVVIQHKGVTHLSVICSLVLGWNKQRQRTSKHFAAHLLVGFSVRSTGIDWPFVQEVGSENCWVDIFLAPRGEMGIVCLNFSHDLTKNGVPVSIVNLAWVTEPPCSVAINGDLDATSGVMRKVFDEV
jgi:hypothetical protein